MSADPTDFELLDRIIAGDADALGVLIARHRPVALRLSFNHLRSREDAEEVVQMAVMSVWRNASKFQRTASFKTWFIKIVLNMTRNRWYYNSRRRQLDHVSLDFQPANAFSDLHDILADERDMRASMDFEEQRERILQALGRLQPQKREIVEMIAFRHMSYEQISRALNIEVGTVKSRLSRARAYLAEELERIDQPPQRQRSAGRHRPSAAPRCPLVPNREPALACA